MVIALPGSSEKRPHENMLIISLRIIQLLKRDFCECVCVCVHHFNLSATRVSPPIHLPPLSDNAQSKKCTMVAICAITDPMLTIGQQHGLIRYISCM